MGGPIGEARRLRRQEVRPERSVTFSAAAVAALGLEGGKVQEIALQMVEALKGIVYPGPTPKSDRRGPISGISKTPATWCRGVRHPGAPGQCE